MCIGCSTCVWSGMVCVSGWVYGVVGYGDWCRIGVCRIRGGSGAGLGVSGVGMGWYSGVFGCVFRAFM